MLTKLGKSVDELSENFNKERENKKNQRPPPTPPKKKKEKRKEKYTRRKSTGRLQEVDE